MMVRGKRIGVEIKRVDAPRRTRSMTIAFRDLSLGALDVVYPGPVRYVIGDGITAVPAHDPFRVN